MITTMYIGSGDIHALLAGTQTKLHASLLQRFVSGIKPYYNAKASPIDACRTGAILEDRYILTLPDDYYAQYVVVSDEMDVFKASLDFAKIESGNVVDFDETKTISFDDFLSIQSTSENERLEYVKKNYKQYYDQVQEQLFCSKLQSANLVFICVYTYDDEVNYNRDIQENEYLKVRVFRDEKVIEMIKERGKIFQQITDFYTKNNL